MKLPNFAPPPQDTATSQKLPWTSIQDIRFEGHIIHLWLIFPLPGVSPTGGFIGPRICHDCIPFISTVAKPGHSIG